MAIWSDLNWFSAFHSVCFYQKRGYAAGLPTIGSGQAAHGAECGPEDAKNIGKTLLRSRKLQEPAWVVSMHFCQAREECRGTELIPIYSL